MQSLDVGIEDLNIGASGSLRITARAVQVDKGRTIPARSGPLEVFAAYFVDRDGRYIYHECMGKEARRLAGQIANGTVYQLTGFVVAAKKPARLMYSLAGPLLLDLSRAQVTPVADDAAIPTRVPPSELETLLALALDVGQAKRTQPVCVEGVVSKLENVRSVETAQGKKEVRNFTLTRADRSIDVAFWGGLASSPLLRDGSALYIGDVDLKIMDGGVSRKLDSRQTTTILPAENAAALTGGVVAGAAGMTAARPGGRGMKRQYSTEAAHYVTCALADVLQGGAKRDGLDEHVLNVRSFQLEDIPSAPLPMYQACDLCGKKADGAGVCSGNTEHGRATAWRWIGRIRIRDGTSTIETTIFNDAAEIILGKKAADAAGRVETGAAPFTPAEAAAARNTLWDGLLVVEGDEFRGENKLTLVRVRPAEPLNAETVRDLRRVRPCPARGPRWPHAALADVSLDAAHQTLVGGATVGGINILAEALEDGAIEREEATSAVVKLRLKCALSGTEAELRVCGPLGACSPLIRATKGDVFAIGCRMTRPGRLALDRMRKVLDVPAATEQQTFLINAAKQDATPVDAETLAATPVKRNKDMIAETPMAGTPFSGGTP